MLLKIVAFTGNVGVHFFTVGQAHTGNLSRIAEVRLFGGSGVHAHTRHDAGGMNQVRVTYSCLQEPHVLFLLIAE